VPEVQAYSIAQHMYCVVITGRVVMVTSHVQIITSVHCEVSHPSADKKCPVFVDKKYKN
jgi:hypothetical protein